MDSGECSDCALIRAVLYTIILTTFYCKLAVNCLYVHRNASICVDHANSSHPADDASTSGHARLHFWWAGRPPGHPAVQKGASEARPTGSSDASNPVQPLEYGVPWALSPTSAANRLRTDARGPGHAHLHFWFSFAFLVPKTQMRFSSRRAFCPAFHLAAVAPDRSGV